MMSPSFIRLKAAALLALSSCAAQTAGPRALALMPGVINRSDNKSLRFAMLKFGLDQFCTEMMARGAPLKLADTDPTIGRFFPQQCDARIVDDDTTKSFLVQFLGFGYGYTNVTKRIGFDSAGVVEYDPDFLLDGSTMYVYFRTKHIAGTSFKPLMIESGAANMALAMAPGGFADKFGQQVVASELSRGFTVVRQSDGSVDFGLGIVEKGKTPFHPYQVKGTERLVLANERIEIHANQREFLGPFSVETEGRALYLTVGIDGAPAVDVLIVPKDAGDPWLSGYVHQPGAAAPPFPPLMQDVVNANLGELRRVVPVAKGRYYLVVDNTATAGQVAPASVPGDDRAAMVNYVVELGDAP